MKLRHYFYVTVIAALMAVLVKGPDPIGVLTSNRLVDLLMPTAHAQLVGGQQGWNNIHVMKVAADIADSATGGTGLQSFQGASFNLPAGPAAAWWYDCQLAYSQATAVVADQFGISFSASPTASQHMLFVSTTAATAPLGGVATNITNTSATQILPTFTPAAISTVYTANLRGYVEMPATTQDTVVQLSMAQATQGDVLTLKRDSACMYHSML